MNKSIIFSARKWLGTPFKHQGRLIGVGCDCLGLIMGVAKECNLKTLTDQPLINLDRTNYHIIADGKSLEQILSTNLTKLHALELGALVLMEFDSNPSHLAIVSDNEYDSFNIIHADMRSSMVVEHILNEDYLKRIKQIYKLI
ncbi:MAG: NlpC/P60 family phage cell wall peptidase [Candidatus Midichloriaceae bacterium]|jgi:cell wall-associated NlpC family hydrolase|nr:NlpC/P60 family phage cell wall peptidase [Candidatus Midichloriaceae bacterium]